MRAGTSAGGGPLFRGRAPRAAIPFFRRPKRDSENIFFFVPSGAEKQSESDLGISLAPQLLSSRPPPKPPECRQRPYRRPAFRSGRPFAEAIPLPAVFGPAGSKTPFPTHPDDAAPSANRSHPPPCKTDIKKLTMRTAGHKTGAKRMRKTEAAHSSPTRAIDRFSRPGELPRSFPPCEGLYLRDARLPASPLRGEERRKPASPARQAPVLPFGPQKARKKIEKKDESPSPFPASEEPGTASGSAPGGTALSFSCPPFRAQTKHHADGSPHPQRTATPRASPDSAPRRSSVEEPPRARVCPPCKLRRTTVRPTAARAPRPFPGR